MTGRCSVAIIKLLGKLQSVPFGTLLRKGETMEFVCYPKCTTCQKAKKWLEEQGILFVERNIKEENPSYEEFKAWYIQSGMPLKKFFNTSGLQYKSLELKEKLPAMSEEEQLHLLATDGMLVKRPILLGEKFVLVGFREEQWKEILK